ncbi:hypothetical protein BKA67DRAFT_654328 [Truncatella angustata]|uniref:Uncharacterized protein n=1 Tax=Truncatella angustata TaxID=152316 RepID=A0A9P8UZF2_9PEZI|nr:uncharacterized protein BKA67DRAFT_654328 [Truncatella angustata]KAH6661197.1 hypothetical protein BKA67DRAFT_654328 [Truncatella angustata]
MVVLRAKSGQFQSSDSIVVDYGKLGFGDDVLEIVTRNVFTWMSADFDAQDDKNRTEYAYLPEDNCKVNEDIPDEHELTHECVRNLVSLFIPAIVPETARVKGETTALPPGTQAPTGRQEEGDEMEPSRLWNNTVFTTMAEILAKEKPTNDVNDACSLTVPAVYPDTGSASEDHTTAGEVGASDAVTEDEVTAS